MRLDPAGLGVAALIATTFATAGSQQPVFRGGVDHVSVDVIVTDADERPVKGLAKQDFEIVEGGRPQAIADFSYVSVPTRSAVVDLEAEPLPPRDVAANARAKESSRGIVIIIDENNLANENIVVTKRVLVPLLEGLGPDDQAAVIYARHSDLGQDFTNDVGRLVAAINRMREAFGFWTASHDPSRDTQVVVRNVAHVLASAPQTRKLIVYVSQRLSLEDPAWPETCDYARRQGVPVYAIDPVAQMESDMPGGMSALAGRTGGRAVVHPWDPAAGAADLMAENNSYYLLGYYPAPFIRDGKFHDIAVHVTRPGVHVRARAGYWATAKTPLSDDIHRVNEALGAGMDNPSLPIRVFAAPVAAGAKGAQTAIVTEVTYPAPGETAQGLNDELHLGIVALDSDGGVKAQHQRMVPLKGTSIGTEPLIVVLDDVIDLPTRPLTLRVAVASRALGATGTAHLPVDVPDPRDWSLRMSGVAIGFSPAHSDFVLNPAALAGVLPFQPATAREFLPSETLRVFARAWWTAGAQAGAALEANVRVEGTGTAQTVTLDGILLKDGHREATLDLALPLQGIAAGTHVLGIEVKRVDAPQQRASRRVVFDVAGK